jgi:predicted amidohydrolase
MIRVTLVQPDIIWEDVDANLGLISGMLDGIGGMVDVVLLPELFTTGFTMRSRTFAESMEGRTMEWMAAKAGQLKCELAGSIIINDEGRIFNRLIWMKEDGSYEHYDKRHLFRMSGEHEHYSPGSRLLTVETRGFRFRPLICYDLRFPVWSRNRGDYDILVYLSNWPARRRDVWNTLLKARALENQAYVIGVNRVGRDGTGIEYRGDTMACDAKGRKLACLEADATGIQTIRLSKEELTRFREKFPAWKDADPFSLEF